MMKIIFPTSSSSSLSIRELKAAESSKKPSDIYHLPNAIHSLSLFFLIFSPGAISNLLSFGFISPEIFSFLATEYLFLPYYSSLKMLTFFECLDLPIESIILYDYLTFNGD